MGVAQGDSMIGWLEGQLAETWQQASRHGVLVVCQGVGYEVQLSQRHWRQLPPAGTAVALHIHHSIRDDGWTLFGFGDRLERDLFRELVAVSGVGPQAGLALLGAMAPAELVQAVVETDLRRLCQAPGVGRRTAERLAVELRQRLQERFVPQLEGGAIGAAPGGDDLTAELPGGASRQELDETLEALGYARLEIDRALRAVAATGLAPEAPLELWIRDCLRWLSRQAA
jgi:Holliday junction DNA helicase RuvA